MRILVTGSREWDDLGVIEAALHEVTGERFPAEYPDVTLVHGAAAGADCYAAGMAYVLGMNVESYPVTKADWARIGKSAGHQRNQKMVDLGADVCLAFIKDESSGATNCAEKAEAAGIKTRRYTA